MKEFVDSDKKIRHVPNFEYEDNDLEQSAKVEDYLMVLVQIPMCNEMEPKEGTAVTAGSSAVNKAKDVVTSILAKGFVLGKDVMGKAKAFDEKHGLTENASAKVTSFDKKIGLTEKISASTVLINEKVKSVDQKFQLSEKTKSAFAAAEQKVNNAGFALMKNKYVFTGASWVTGAFSRVTKAAEDVGMKTKEKFQLVEGLKKDRNSTSSGYVSHDFAQVHLTEPGNTYEPLSSATHSGKYSSLSRYDSGSFCSPSSSTQASGEPTKPPPAQGLIL